MENEKETKQIAEQISCTTQKLKMIEPKFEQKISYIRNLIQKSSYESLAVGGLIGGLSAYFIAKRFKFLVFFGSGMYLGFHFQEAKDCFWKCKEDFMKNEKKKDI